MIFRDRHDAGRQLASLLEDRYCGEEGVVYALPRGGVPLAALVAKALQMPMDLVIPRKIGHPNNPEYAICAVAEGGELLCNESEREYVDESWLQRQVIEAVEEARRRREQYLVGRNPLPVRGKTAVVVDDGIATGLTMRAAICDIKSRCPARIVVAIPVIPADTYAMLQTEVDDVVAILVERTYLGAVGSYYLDFPQLDDRDVIELMMEQG